MGIKDFFWLFLKSALLIFFIILFYESYIAIGLPLEDCLIYAIALYLFYLICIIFLLFDILDTILFYISPQIRKIIKYWKDISKKPEVVGPEKPKKKKIKRIKTIQGYTITTEKKGDLFKRLGIKYEKIKKPKTKNVMDLGEIERLEPKIYRRDLTPYIKQLDNKGYIEVSNNDHFGKLRSYDIILYLRKELKRQGIKTKKIRKRLYKV